MTKVLLLAGLLVADASSPREQCYSDSGWHGSGYYPCGSDVWKDDYGSTRRLQPSNRGRHNDRNSGVDPE
jgi:hypothetical protein